MSINILLADDSITIQKVICIIFGGDEYSLTIVDNGKAVLDTARQSNPDILLIDALMPDMSGYEVCEQIRATPGLSHKPILLLVGSFEPFDEDKAKKSGADDFIAKPFESLQIVAKVQELVRQSAARPADAPHPAEPEMSAVAPSANFAAPAQEAVALDDIWGAFTAPAEPADPVLTPAIEPDPFAIIEEEQAPSILPPEQQIATGFGEQYSPSPWTPVDETSFQFIEEPAAGIPADSPAAPPLDETSFGEISFEEPEDAPPVSFSPSPASQPLAETTFSGPDFGSLFAEPPLTEVQVGEIPQPVEVLESREIPEPDSMFAEIVPQAVQPPHEPLPVPPAPELQTGVQLTEEQLKVALAGVSKEIIERIVWEIVPDLAEQLISEAIRKIREGR